MANFVFVSTKQTKLALLIKDRKRNHDKILGKVPRGIGYTV